MAELGVISAMGVRITRQSPTIRKGFYSMGDSIVHAPRYFCGRDDYSRSACGEERYTITKARDKFGIKKSTYSSFKEAFDPVVTCKKCIDAFIPGTALYNKSPGVPREIPIDKRFFPAIIEALREVDSKRRFKNNVDSDRNLTWAIVELMEACNFRLPPHKCSKCHGTGKIDHRHSMYCYSEGMVDDYLNCNSSSDRCEICRGKGSIDSNLLE